MNFHDFLLQRIELAALATEDVLASFLPLLREVIEAHRAGAVAPLEGLVDLHVDGQRIWFEEAKRSGLLSAKIAILLVWIAYMAFVFVCVRYWR